MTEDKPAPVCPRCRERARHPRRTGGYRSWCKECESAQKGEYMKTEAGKDAVRRYQRSDKGRAVVNRNSRNWYHRNKKKSE